MFSLQYHHSQAVRFEGALTVFRNIEYFRKFMGAAYKTPKGDTVEVAQLFWKYGHWYDNYYRLMFMLCSVV